MSLDILNASFTELSVETPFATERKNLKRLLQTQLENIFEATRKKPKPQPDYQLTTLERQRQLESFFSFHRSSWFSIKPTEGM
jgi:hypothetical protein